MAASSLTPWAIAALALLSVGRVHPKLAGKIHIACALFGPSCGNVVGETGRAGAVAQV